RQADAAVLGGDVRPDTRVAGYRADGCVVDDRAASLAFHLPQFVLHIQLHMPRKLIPITRSQSSGELLAVGAMWAITPALLNATSSRPNSVTVRSTIAATWASSLTSQRIAIALEPAAVSFWASARTASSLKSASTTAAPAWANALAVASPIPAAAPVTSATLFSKDKFISCLNLGIRFTTLRFRCPRRRTALADCANLLAIRATS